MEASWLSVVLAETPGSVALFITTGGTCCNRCFVPPLFAALLVAFCAFAWPLHGILPLRPLTGHGRASAVCGSSIGKRCGAGFPSCTLCLSAQSLGLGAPRNWVVAHSFRPQLRRFLRNFGACIINVAKSKRNSYYYWDFFSNARQSCLPDTALGLLVSMSG